MHVKLTNEPVAHNWGWGEGGGHHQFELPRHGTPPGRHQAHLRGWSVDIHAPAIARETKCERWEAPQFVGDRAGAAHGNHCLIGRRFLRHAAGIQDYERQTHSSNESGTEDGVVHFPIPLLIEHSARKTDLSRSIKFNRPGEHLWRAHRPRRLRADRFPRTFHPRRRTLERQTPRGQSRTSAFGCWADLYSGGPGGGIFVFSSGSCRIRQSSFV